jgi:TolB protein
VASHDGRYVAFVRLAADGSDQLVVAARGGSGEHEQPVFGSAAAIFDPTGDRVASIAPDRPGQSGLAFPIGPLRLTDAATGATRVLLDGSVVAFFWSPNGRTIAALRLQSVGGGSFAAIERAVDLRPALSGEGRAAESVVGAAASESPTPGPSASAAPGPAGPIEVRLVFVDVATGTVRSQRVVDPAARFVNELLPYFDQYAVSHRLWAPDASSLLLPVLDGAGVTHLVGFPPDGGAPVMTIDGEVGFWSP